MARTPRTLAWTAQYWKTGQIRDIPEASPGSRYEVTHLGGCAWADPSRRPGLNLTAIARTIERVLFAMIRKGGPAWDGSRPLREQDKWGEHAAYMDELADEGFVVLAGPLGDGHLGQVDSEHRVLLIFDAHSESTIHARLDTDPWTPMGMLETVSLEPWNVLLGALSGR